MIDSHCHLHDEKYASDLTEVLKRAKDAGVTRFVTIGCDIETTKRAQALAKVLPNVFFSAGYHPHEARFLNDETLLELKKYAVDKKCVAIGETGLDFYYEHSSKEDQERAFRKQIELAKELSLPVVIHLRDAFIQCISILNEHKDYTNKMVIHCFSGTLSEAIALEKLGCYISLSGIVTFKKPGELLEVAKEIPLDKLLIETDCPYLAPHPHRGQRNEPAYLAYTLQAVAQARGEPLAHVSEKIALNTALFFGFNDT